MGKRKVLFICVHNSARSQMAEAFLKQMAGDRFDVESTGLESGKLNPLAVEVMKEVGIDISQNKTKSVFDFYKQGKVHDYVITYCFFKNKISVEKESSCGRKYWRNWPKSLVVYGR